MEELEYLWSVLCVRPVHLAGAFRYDLHASIGDEEMDFVHSFDHYPDEEEVFAALAMWRAERG